MAVLGLPSGPIGFVAPLGFKILDSQPDSSNMGPVPTDFNDFRQFQKSQDGFLTRYLSCFRTGTSKLVFSRFSVGTKKMHDEKLRRIVVVSPREVPYLTFSCLFKIFSFPSFLQAHPICLSQSWSLVFTKFCHQPSEYHPASIFVGRLAVKCFLLQPRTSQMRRRHSQRRQQSAPRWITYSCTYRCTL